MSLQLQPAVVLDAAVHKCASALTALQNPIGLQGIDGLAQCDAGDLEIRFQLLERRDLIANLPLSRLDPPAERRGDLKIERHPAALIGSC